MSRRTTCNFDTHSWLLMNGSKREADYAMAAKEPVACDRGVSNHISSWVFAKPRYRSTHL
ncbi:hypothetical protein KY290_030554 [Solanum tuberosum]|uniref:Uncharacterized protein n=1 Tax=Solanum tuberosum TaxID=4113 RepID=A0ABQ7U8A4_SOLTU|nr:hypothetical protein KY284_029576 [Solanum tuberosum]KAH0742561.1 hypothetical protein KY290_030554 [Solanum tuberosum]